MVGNSQEKATKGHQVQLFKLSKCVHFLHGRFTKPSQEIYKLEIGQHEIQFIKDNFCAELV